MRVIYLSWLPEKVNGGSFYPFIFLNKRLRGTEKEQEVLTHEQIHHAQSKELFVIPFYILYVINFLYNMFRYKFDIYKSYRQVLFEREAFAHQNDPWYVLMRNPFDWRG